MNASNLKSTRHGRKRFVIPAVCLGVIGLFYAEEDWRGKCAWEQCKQAVASRNIPLNWTNYIPAAVPEDQNIFGVPEMVRWFSYQHGAGWSDFALALPSATFPGFNLTSNTASMTVAEIVIGQPGTSAPGDSIQLRRDDPASRTAAANLIDRALGPVAKAPQSPIGVGLMLREPNEVRPAKIFCNVKPRPRKRTWRSFCRIR
jgi:hypothetical protein